MRQVSGERGQKVNSQQGQGGQRPPAGSPVGSRKRRLD